jgi:hypothetical protein
VSGRDRQRCIGVGPTHSPVELVWRSSSITVGSTDRQAPRMGFSDGCDMTVYEIDPMRDPRWDEFLETHQHASIFHTRRWLEALRRPYGYAPVAFTTSSPGHQIVNGLPFCQIPSWLSGRRLVSLPFSDHCAASGKFRATDMHTRLFTR